LQPETSSDNLSLAETASALPESFYSQNGPPVNTLLVPAVRQTEQHTMEDTW
jgi:hypothetical protein